ncbi:MAG: ATP-binding protein [Solirubrobacteraceae bacterium]
MALDSRPASHRPEARVRPVHVTFLFTDIEGSTQLARRLGQDEWMKVISDHHRIVGDAITASGGSVDHTEGDAFVAVFTDASAAVTAAVQAQRGIEEHAWPQRAGRVRVRMGLHTGTVLEHSTGYVGLDAHLAARVASAANGGQILITSATLDEAGGRIAVRDLGAHRLKDFPEPERLYHVMVETVDERPVPAPRTASVRPTNLPPQTRALVGRERERTLLHELLLSDARQVVTLTGIGGSGKTRLALEVARDLLDDSPGGVFLVRLAGVSDPDSIVPMIAEALGLTGHADVPLRQLVAGRLGDQRTLLILDNFEQLIDGAAIIAALAENAPAVRILVTSQVPLRIAAERTVPLEPLAQGEAVMLFVERARVLLPEFAPDEDDRAAIEAICARLDFMPLAIELAAARVGVFAPRELERRLKRPLTVLTHGERDAPERQRSLRATIEWTYSLLDPGSRDLFARLGACVGAVPLEAVEALAGGNGSSTAALEQLEQLLEFSFARRQEDRRLGLRFFVPQALRDYALERLIAAGDEDGVRRLHAEYVAMVAHNVRLWKWGTTSAQRTALLAVADEIRTAVATARNSDPELHVRICAGLAAYWVYRGVISEVSDEFRRARASGLGSRADRAWLLTLLAKCAQLEGDQRTAAELVGQVRSEWDRVEDEVERALGLQQVSWVARWASRYAEGIELAQEALAILRRTEDRNLLLRGLVYLAHALADAGDPDATEAVLAEAAPLAAEDPTWELTPIYADCALMRGDNAAALELYTKSLGQASANGESHQVMMDTRAVALSLLRLGRTEPALEASELVALEEQRTGRLGDAPDWTLLRDELTRARQAVDAEVLERATTRARSVPVAARADRVVELARATPNSPAALRAN